MPDHLPESKYLGKSSQIPASYDPSVLVAVPRENNRKDYGISHLSSAMKGWDVWHAYEAGFLTDKGLPVTGVLKIVYPANTPFIVESKSLKLYLNSLNEEHLGADRNSAIANYENTVKADLEKLLQGEVELKLHQHPVAREPALWQDFEIIEEMHHVEHIDFKGVSGNDPL